MVRKALIRAAYWILRRYNVPLSELCWHLHRVNTDYRMAIVDAGNSAIPKEVKALLPAAKELCAEFDKLQASGEAKRHQVYAAMIKAHPSVSRRTIALAIEHALPEK